MVTGQVEPDGTWEAFIQLDVCATVFCTPPSRAWVRRVELEEVELEEQEMEKVRR